MMHWYTTGPELQTMLRQLMVEPLFDPFCLVGGTSLSLQWGHRLSVDIDLFTDSTYGQIDFSGLVAWFRDHYAYLDGNFAEPTGLGISLFAGTSVESAVKIDLYYTDAFIRPVLHDDGIRIADFADVLAMKLDIIGRKGGGGRKKDFWDLHRAMDYTNLHQMLDMYAQRYPYGHTTHDLLTGLTSFSFADDDFEPLCLEGKHWELIKEDIRNWVRGFLR
jgi:hypothetical protein